MSYTPPKNLKLSGDSKAVTPASTSDNDTSIATTEWVQSVLGNPSSARPACRIANAAAPTHNSTGNWLDYTFDSETFDNDNMHSTSANTQRITANTAGVYQVSASVFFNTTVTGLRGVKILAYNSAGVLQGTVAYDEWGGDASNNAMTVSGGWSASAGDYFVVQWFQSSGGNLTSAAPGWASALWTGSTGAAWGNASGKMARAAAQSITNAAWNDCTFDTTLVTGAGMTTAASTVPLTCVNPGTYTVACNAAFVGNTTGERGVRFVHKNSAGTILGVYGVDLRPSTVGNSQCSSTDSVVMAAGDFLQMQVYQSSGGSLNTGAGSGTYHFTLSASRNGLNSNSSKIIGEMTVWPGITIPPLHLAAQGQSLLSASYPSLYAALNPTVSTVTVTLASPGVWTTPVAHNLKIGDRVFVTTTGALPTGVTASTNYYVMTVPTSTTFTLGTTRSVAAATGAISVTTAVNTSVSQSGVHTLVQSPWGTADSTHFYLPDSQNMDLVGQASGGVIGISWGEVTHTLASTEIPAHTHPNTAVTVANNTGGRSAAHTHAGVFQVGSGTSYTTGANAFGIGASPAETTDHTHGIPALAVTMTNANNTGGGGAHNNIQPGIRVNWMIYAGV